ncbi:MAG: hypothetical protein HIU93_13260 [Acidobacteria bacterium]|nr:hypothetical protein [Acidobacteriota bacterium]
MRWQIAVGGLRYRMCLRKVNQKQNNSPGIPRGDNWEESNKAIFVGGKSNL